MKRFAKMHAALLSLAQLGNTTFHQVNALLIMVKWKEKVSDVQIINVQSRNHQRTLLPNHQKPYVRSVYRTAHITVDTIQVTCVCKHAVVKLKFQMKIIVECNVLITSSQIRWRWRFSMESALLSV